MAANVTQTITGASNSLISAPTSRILHQKKSSATGDVGGPKSSFLQGSGAPGKLKPSFAKSLAPLDVAKKHESYLHVQYVFKPEAVNSLEPVTLTVSTPLSAAEASWPRNPGHKVDLLTEHVDIVRDLGRLFKLPSPESKDVEVSVDVKRHPYADLQVGERWREIQGSQDWEGLVEEKAMDPVFRGEVIRYGDFAQATYDAFDDDHESALCGNALFDKTQLLAEVGLLNRGYEISEYIYATAEAHVPKFFRKSANPEDAWSKDSNFMGFVAVCTSPRELKRLGRRDIVVAWRGTVTKLEWIENVQDRFSPAGLDPRAGTNEVMVESGFLSVYKSKNEKSRYNKLSAREQVLAAVKNLVQKYKHEEMSITVTGHSLGSALSMLCAYDIAESGINKRVHSPKVPQNWDEPQLDGVHPDQLQTKPKEDDSRVPVSVFSFAGPRLGNSAFKDRVEELGVKVLRVVNIHDIVPKVPGVIFNERLAFLHTLAHWLPSSYAHVGKVIELDSNVSEYLRDTTDPLNAHNLEAYLHLLDGYHGSKARFSPAVRRDIALVNKGSDFLEHKFGIPENWWADKKMILDAVTGSWVIRNDEAQILISPSGQTNNWWEDVIQNMNFLGLHDKRTNRKTNNVVQN